MKQADLMLLFLALAAAFFGVVLIYSALLRQGNAVVQKNIMIQLVAIFLGLIGFFITSIVDIERFSQFWPVIFVLNLLFQASLFVFGVGEESTGNNSWLRFGSIGIQPAEVGKILFIFTFAQHIFARRDHINAFPTVIELLGHSLITIGTVYITSGDVGMAFTYLVITLIMLACSGMSTWWVGGVTLGGIGSTPLLWKYVLKDYHRLRIEVVFNPAVSPKYAYHAKQSMAAIRNGGVLGQGLTHGTLTQSGLLPTSHTDFIFSVCGEELGFIGCAAIVLLLSFIVMRIFYNASKANDRFGFLMCVGIGSMIMIQTLINIGMCAGIMPVIGLTLPFFSYGGTSVMTMLIAIGFTSGFASRQNQAGSDMERKGKCGDLKKGDVLIAGLFLVLAGMIFFSGVLRPSSRLTAVITQNGKEIQRIELAGLTSPVTVTVTGKYQNVIVADRDGVRVASSTCPLQTCVHTGKLTRAGSCAVCMENKMVVTLVGDGGFDAVAK